MTITPNTKDTLKITCLVIVLACLLFAITALAETRNAGQAAVAASTPECG